MNNPLTSEERKLLLEIARDSIFSFILQGEIPPRTITDPKLQKRLGCFVSIKKNGALRGCIGNFTSDKPLWQMIQEMAVSAATRDPRFYPMKKEDLTDFSLEISILSPLQRISSIEEIVVGIHGLYIEKNFSRGVLLPQVAVELGWNREVFLDQTCIKAGLKKDSWQEGADIYIFSAEVFGEK